MTLNIITWFWQQKRGRAKYKPEHVNKWADMVDQHLSTPHQLYCVTNEPQKIDSRVKVLPMPDSCEHITTSRWSKEKGKPQCFRRIDMFRSDAADFYGDRFVCMDLDCVIFDSIDSLFDRDEDFVMCEGTHEKRPYNGSMMMIRAGTRPQVFNLLTKERAKAASDVYIGSDQAWISYCLGWCEATWGEKDGVFYYGKPENRRAKPPEGLKIMFFPGHPKPWEVKNIRWIRDAYNGGK